MPLVNASVLGPNAKPHQCDEGNQSPGSMRLKMESRLMNR